MNYSELIERIEYLEQLSESKDQTIQKATIIIEQLKEELITLQNEKHEKLISQQRLSQPLQQTTQKQDSAKKRMDLRNTPTQMRRLNSQGRRSSEIEDQTFGKQTMKEINKPYCSVDQEVLIQYKSVQINDWKWEQAIDNICVYFSKVQNKIKQRVNEKDYLAIADQASTYWIERYQQVESLLSQALNKIDVQSSLLYDMQFHYQFLIRQSHDLLMIIGKLQQQSNQISNETSIQVDQLNQFCKVNLSSTLEELYNCSKSSLKNLAEEIRNQIDIQTIDININKQAMLKNEFEIVSLQKEIESLNQRLHLISFNYDEVLKEILKIMDPNYLIERNSSANQQPIQVQNKQKQVIHFIKSYQEVVQRNKDLENDIFSLKKNSDMLEKQIRQEEQQNLTLNKQIKQLQLLFQESEQKSELLQMQLKQKEEEEISMREKYLLTCEKLKQMENQHKIQQENFNFLIEQFDTIKEENTLALKNYEEALETLQKELDKSSLQNQQYRTNESDLNLKVKNLTFLADSQKRVIDQNKENKIQDSTTKEFLIFTQNFALSLQKCSEQQELDFEQLLKDIKLPQDIRLEYKKIMTHLNKIHKQFYDLQRIETLRKQDSNTSFKVEKQFLDLMYGLTTQLGQLSKNENNSLEIRLEQMASYLSNNKVSQLLIIKVIQQYQNFKMIVISCAEIFLELSTFFEFIFNSQKEMKKIQQNFMHIQQTTQNFIVQLQEVQKLSITEKWLNQMETIR